MTAINVKWIKDQFWLEVEHDGNITFDQMQAIKNEWFGPDVAAVEVYPAECDLVDNGNFRHLWRSPSIAGFL